MIHYSEWKPSPWWLRPLGRYVRSRYASMMIGGGWDGFEFTDNLEDRP